MTTVTYSVPAMHCDHCTHTIEMEVGELQGVQAVKADLSTKSSDHVRYTRQRTEHQSVALGN